MPESRPATAASQTPKRADDRTCAKHGIRTAPDGLCALCRREASAQKPSAGSQLGTLAFGLLALLCLAVVIYWAMNPTEMPGERPPPITAGPPLEDQIKAVDEQIQELERLRVAGELGGGGLQRLSQLQTKRTLLKAALDAARD